MSGGKIILLGYSGHGLVVVESALLLNICVVGYSDKEASIVNPFKLVYLGDERLNNYKYWQSDVSFILGVGDNQIRNQISKRVLNQGAKLATIIHPDASISQLSKIGRGVFVARNAAINPLCEIGDGVIINTSASVDHDCTIGDYSHIAPGAVLAGNVKIGKQVFVGANSVIKQGVVIGDGATIGAGSVILSDVPQNKVVVGNPGRKIC